MSEKVIFALGLGLGYNKRKDVDTVTFTGYTQLETETHDAAFAAANVDRQCYSFDKEARIDSPCCRNFSSFIFKIRNMLEFWHTSGKMLDTQHYVLLHKHDVNQNSDSFRWNDQAMIRVCCLLSSKLLCIKWTCLDRTVVNMNFL